MIRRFLDRPNDDAVKIFGMAFLVALVCAALVSVTSVALKPRQQAYLQAERDARMAAMLDALPGMRALMEEAGVDRLETRYVDLASGQVLEGGEESGGAPVHLLEKDGSVYLVVLPMQGEGYQSTIQIMLALEPDLNTVAAVTVLEHGETPGLGARIAEPEWQDLWPGKLIADENGEILINVVRGQATTPYEVDGISGATRSSAAVSTMMRHWLGPDGYGPYLAKLKAEVF